MIDILIDLLKHLLAILPFILLCLRSKKTNLPESDRSRQYPMPVIAILYSIVCMFFIDSINDWLFNLINDIPRWISGLANYSWMPAGIGNFFISIGSFLMRLIRSINLGYWIFYISNFVILSVYLILKKLAISIISRIVKHDGNLHTKVAERFYEYFYERNLWCLKESFAQVRSFLKTFYYTSIGISSVLLIISVEMFKNGSLQSAFYPVFSIVLVGELWFYLCGLTQKEYSDILGEDDEAYRIANYSILRKFLRTLFKDKLLAENTDLNSALSYGVTTEDVLNELEKDEDPKINCMAAYFKALHKTGLAIDHNYLQSTVDLLCGKSILFNNPFYKDLIPYAFYPINRTLLSHRKVLVVLGRHAIEDDIMQWIEEGVGSITNIPFLWNVSQLSESIPDADIDIGIVSRSNVLNIKMQEANSSFLKDVGFVVILEPSKLITTAQIGLNLLIKRCETAESKPVYCMCDKNCDGLVDAMSHILTTNITEVAATNKHTGTSSYMCWDADGEYMQHRMLPNISRYLGFGTELSFAALKNQVAKTEWYGGEAFPVSDMQWISRQYYYDLTKYAGLPTNQESMSEYFKTSANFWSAETSERNYFTVEDEAFNMFEILRGFSTRTKSQGFINVISQEYLLREYMAENAPIFETDAKAIPYIAADHARTRRNTVLKLLLLMSTRPVGANIIEKEFSMLGIPVKNLAAQLWLEIYKCFAPANEVAELDGKSYEEAVSFVALKRICNSSFDIGRNVLVVKNGYDIDLERMQERYSITDKNFISYYVSALRSASYISEDEKGETNFLGAEICGHVYQKYLPGQFFTFGGKYYEMQTVTPDNQVLLRRAADHITGRPAYRQIRNYCIKGFRKSEEVGAVREISGMKITREFADIVVSTEGYYNLSRYNDFTTAQLVSFPEGIPERVYCNKSVLRIDLPEGKHGFNDRVRYTVTVLFNEIFRSLFAENHAYICAVTGKSFVESGDTDPLTYSLSASGCEIDQSSVYIIEDSQLDLGLLVAVERNLNRIFGIMYEYLNWHERTLNESLETPIEQPDPISFGPAPVGKKGIVRRLIDRVKRLFGMQTDEPDSPKDEPKDEPKPEKPKKKGLWGRIKDKLKRKKKKKKKGGEEPVDTPEEPTDTPEEPADTPEEPSDTPEEPSDTPMVPTEAPEEPTPSDQNQ